MRGKSIIFYGVGWYLLLPPYINSGGVVPLPNPTYFLNKWTINESYDTAAQCRKGKEKLQKLWKNQFDIADQEKNKDPQDKKKEFSLHQADAGVLGAAEALCIASDDPRLRL